MQIQGRRSLDRRVGIFDKSNVQRLGIVSLLLMKRVFVLFYFVLFCFFVFLFFFQLPLESLLRFERDWDLRKFRDAVEGSYVTMNLFATQRVEYLLLFTEIESINFLCFGFRSKKSHVLMSCTDEAIHVSMGELKSMSPQAAPKSLLSLWSSLIDFCMVLIN